MKAFSVVGRALASFYNDLFLLVGMTLLWWVTGGIFVGASIAVAWILLQSGGPWWLAPLLAIPAGPAGAALANVARQSARDLHADRSFFFDGLRQYWRRALALNAIGMVILALLMLNMVFYFSLTGMVLRFLAFFWAYLIVFCLGVQLYLFAVLVGLQVPTVSGALRLAAAMALANPLFSVIVIVLAAILTGLSIILFFVLILAWPAIMALVGEHSVKYLVERATQRSS